MGTAWGELRKVTKANGSGDSLTRPPVPAPVAAFRGPMQRIPRLAACRELGGLAVCSPGLRAWRKGPTGSRQWAGTCVRPARPFSGEPGSQGRRLSRRRFVFASQDRRLCSSQSGADGTPGKPDGQSVAISVIGIPDPITWIHCRVQMFLIQLFFDLDTGSAEFHRGVKQVTQRALCKVPLHHC